MADIMTALAGVYVLGLLVGLFVVDEPFSGRLVVAAAWPVGPFAFVAVVTILLLALPIAMPRAAAVLALLVGVVGGMLYFAL